MARPKKEEPDKFKHRFTFWFSDEHKKKFDELNLKSGDKIRDFVIDTYSKKTIYITANKDPKYINELNKIGVNLNQIARKYNSLGEISNLDIGKINSLVDVLEEFINKNIS